eukprot:TRINITY_DN7083_c0_g1_i5.p1 TRINITY_DN7083_c0_g1~~TRINITY_DN7083_c0_g1_i5.p1  ORF type:complete len:386 (+),score=77.73 TRINITY_DN7083_c0_g1_i5:1594-2751(+)
MDCETGKSFNPRWEKVRWKLPCSSNSLWFVEVYHKEHGVGDDLFLGCCGILVEDLLEEIPLDELRLEKTYPLVSKEDVLKTLTPGLPSPHKNKSNIRRIMSKKATSITGLATFEFEWEPEVIMTSSIKNAQSPYKKHFGLPLAQSLLACKKSGQEHIVIKLCQYLIRHGTRQQGIFRINPSPKVVSEMKEIVDDGGILQLELYKVIDLAGFLKSYMRELPERVVPSSLWDNIKSVETIKELQDEEDIEKVKAVIQLMPVENRLIFTHIIHLLSSISYWHDINKMTSDNLATIWAPTLLVPHQLQSDPFQFLSISKLATQILTFIIDYAHEIFNFQMSEKIWWDEESSEDGRDDSVKDVTLTPRSRLLWTACRANGVQTSPNQSPF